MNRAGNGELALQLRIGSQALFQLGPLAGGQLAIKIVEKFIGIHFLAKSVTREIDTRNAELFGLIHLGRRDLRFRSSEIK